MLPMQTMSTSSTLLLASRSRTPPSGLTSEEAQRLRDLEHVIDEGMEGFLKVGAALLEIRTARLYRSTHDTFASYCRDRWGLSLSRCNQIINSIRVVENITGAFPEDAPLLAEHTLRPLSRLEPELQVVTWELIRHLEERPSGTTVEQVVTTIREAIATGWQEREAPREPSKGRNGTSLNRTHHRASDQLGAFFRSVNKMTSWDPVMIAAADDEPTLRRHLKAARALQAFCSAFIQALEERLAK
jgi:hypothetical protein